MLCEVPLDDLQLALRVSDEDLVLFETIAEGEPLGRIPPLASWTFQEKEAVVLMCHPVIPAALPGTQFKADLGAMADGVEGSIEKVYDFVYDVNFTEEGKVIGQRSVPYHNLVKKLSVGQTVRHLYLLLLSFEQGLQPQVRNDSPGIYPSYQNCSQTIHHGFIHKLQLTKALWINPWIYPSQPDLEPE